MQLKHIFCMYMYMYMHIYMYICAIIIASLYIEALSFVCESTVKLVNHRNTEN